MGDDMNQKYPLIIPVPVETRRNCIVQNDRTYCEQGPDLTHTQIGWVILATIVLVGWGVGPMIASTFDRWPLKVKGTVAWYVIPPILLGLGFLLS